MRDVIGAPSIFKLTRRAAALARVLPTFALKLREKGRAFEVKESSTGMLRRLNS